MRHWKLLEREEERYLKTDGLIGQVEYKKGL